MNALVSFLPKEALSDKNPSFKSTGPGLTAVVAGALGTLFGLGVGLAFFSEIPCIGSYLMFLSFFHFSEYIWVAIYHPDTLSVDSFLINHSREYTMAIVGSVLEFLVEYWLFPSLKFLWLLTWLGIIVALAGQVVRLLALFTAQHNFTHDIAEEKKEEHYLVTNGIYQYSRHPGYLGWFYWSVATQVVLLNPLCTAAFVYVSWNFFKDRIAFEEETLVKHFGEKYQDYKKRVPTLIPLIP